eukprot:TRINITY_DN17008_c0_g1_i1.p1 TRINITY_DN17008_c0_g1~~TRINITY_DN17008_c0_g1_i1.p1  ORF type:complete len:187 (-),score=51.96 TRINITY_DN17008_c0_g1_i1:164-724(-)
MSIPAIRVPPDPRYVGEVVLLLTTLGAKRTEFNAGKRARDLLEIKRVHHKVVDFNRDARAAGTGEAENVAIQKLMNENKLETNDEGDLLLPQVFIDGNYIGDATELQGLEDDGVLDAVIERRRCMKCLAKRAPAAKACPSCNITFEEILPNMMRIEDTLEEMAYGEYGDYDDYDEEGEEEEAPAAS